MSLEVRVEGHRGKECDPESEPADNLHDAPEGRGLSMGIYDGISQERAPVNSRAVNAHAAYPEETKADAIE